MFQEVPLDVFWGNLSDEYPEISKRTVRVLLPFSTTYLRESGFSRHVSTKTKYRSKLDMRIQLSSIKPNFQRIMMSKKQMHSSHWLFFKEVMYKLLFGVKSILK